MREEDNNIKYFCCLYPDVLKAHCCLCHLQDNTGSVVVIYFNKDGWSQIGITLFGNKTGENFGYFVGITDNGNYVFVSVDQIYVKGGSGNVSKLNLSTNQN